MDKPQWEDVYRGYVIRHYHPPGVFIGLTSELRRVVKRKNAARFTKQEALDYIVRGEFCSDGGGPFVIEDAT